MNLSMTDMEMVTELTVVVIHNRPIFTEEAVGMALRLRSGSVSDFVTAHLGNIHRINRLLGQFHITPPA
jgi:hypothetical protein